MKTGMNEYEEIELSVEEQGKLWEEWAETGPQGPIPDEDADQAAEL